MYRFSVPILLILLLAAGCQSTAPTTDPFFGRTTIPPPGTGSATGRCADPYYQPPAPIQNPPTAVAQPTTTTILPNAVGSTHTPPRPTSTGTSNGSPPATYPSNTAPPYHNPNSASPPPVNTNPNPPISPTPSPSDWTPSGSSSTTTSANRPGINVSLSPSSNMTSGRSGSFDDRTPRPVNNGAANPPANAPITRPITPRTTDSSDRVIDLKDLPPAD